MPMAPSGYIHRGHIDSIIEAAKPLLGPEVLHVAYRIRPDSTDEPSIFFSVLLTDAAAHDDTIVAVTRRVAEVLREAVRPLEDWGLNPYFNYRTKSEQERRRDPDWE
jgi:hypothetical protein